MVAGALLALGATMLNPTGAAHAGPVSIDPLDGTVVAAGSMAAGRLDLFLVGPDSALHHRAYVGGQWSGWEDLGGALNSAPSVASWGPGRLDVFARGVDNAIWTLSFDNGRWGTWGSLGGTLTSAPSVTSWGPGRLDVFARGVDNAIWQATFDNGRWYNWGSLGGTLTSAPSAASWGSGRLDVFARGVDKAIWQATFDNGRWYNWGSLGGTLTSAPSAASWGPGRVDVFGRGVDNVIYQATFDNGRWYNWAYVGGDARSAPAAASSERGRLDVFTLDAGNEVRQQTYDGRWSEWRRASGVAPTVPIERNAPTSVLQLEAVNSETVTPVVYSYVDNIGRLRHGHQSDPTLTGSVRWTTFPADDAYSGRPALLQQPDGRLQVATRQTDGDVSTVTQREPGGVAWNPAVDVGGWLTSQVTSGKLPDGRLVLFGVDADGVLFAKQQPAANGGYGAWRRLGDLNLAGAPTVARTRNGLRLFAHDSAGRLRSAEYTVASALSSWLDLGNVGSTGSPAVVSYPGFQMRLVVRAGDGTVVTKAQDATGHWPVEWQSTGSPAVLGTPAAILDPVLGRTAMVARGTDNQIYRVWETEPGSGAWGVWDRALKSDTEPVNDPTVTDPTVAPVTTANGATWFVVFRNANDATRIYERTLVAESAASLAARAAAQIGTGPGKAKQAERRTTRVGTPTFAATTLPTPPDAG